MLSRHKKKIALEHLRAAMWLYQEGNAFYSSLHLAAAAEEILGQLIKNSNERIVKDSDSHALQQRIDIEMELGAIFDGELNSREEVRKRVVRPKNYVKHFSRSEALLTELDSKLEARIWLLQAISNLDELGSREPDIDGFEILLRTEETDEAFILLERYRE